MTKFFARACWIAAPIAGLAAGTCKKNDEKTEPVATSQPAPAAAEQRTKRIFTDREVTEAVEKSLANDPGVDARDVAVKATEGVVELTGSVGDLLSKARAVRIAETVKGVRSVSDRIALRIKDRPDHEIAENVRSVLLLNAATDVYEIEVKAQNGAVELSGRVESHQESELAERLAQGVKGVRDVVNRIRIDYDAQPLDIEIERAISSRLRWDILVNDGLLSVEVDGGKVTLDGTVASAAERRRATMDAWVKGVKSVDARGVEVAWWAEERDLRRNKFVKRSDAAISDAIRDAAAYDPRVSTASLSTDVDDGVVTLRGRVESPRAKLAAESIARRTVGVLSVRNELLVVPQQPVADRTLEDQIRTALVYDPYLESFEISVRAKGGKVTLKGKVGTRFERAEATEIVSGIKGVKDLDNDLVVELDGVVYSYDPYLDPYDPLVEQWLYVPSKPSRGDEQIAAEIRHELRFSPFVNEDEVKVTVEEGIATLRGVVDSSGERAAAAQNAYRGGAIAVNNELQIGPPGS